GSLEPERASDGRIRGDRQDDGRCRGLGLLDPSQLRVARVHGAPSDSRFHPPWPSAASRPDAYRGRDLGAAVARLFGHPLGPAARTGALSVTGMVALLEIPVHLSQVLPMPGWLPVPLGNHVFFSLVFMTEVALVSGVASA